MSDNAWISEIFSGRLPKENENISDCQDFYKRDRRGRFAIADGASQSFYSNIWAEKLVNHFCKTPDIDESNWQHWLQPIQKSWLLDVEKRVKQAREDNKPTWVTNQNRLKFGEYATSTFVGLQFLDSQVKISVVGDSYLFILEGGELIRTYPEATYADDFGDRPEYLASNEKDSSFQPVIDLIELKNIGSQIHFILATDALSEYIFRCHESGDKKIFSNLLHLSNIEEFRDFVSHARHSQKIKLKNDDVALVILSVSEKNKSGKIVRLQPDHEAFHDTVLDTDSSVAPPPISREKTSLEPSKKKSDLLSLFDSLPVGQKILAILTTKTQVSSSPVKGRRPGSNRKTKEDNIKIVNLKRQRSLLIGLCLLTLFFLVGDSFLNHRREPKGNQGTTTSTNSGTRDTSNQTLVLYSRTPIYEDETLRQDFLAVYPNNSFEVDVVERGDGWIKIEAELYAYEPEVLNDREIIISSTSNVRLHPDDELEISSLFGQLSQDKIFLKNMYERQPWYKFKLVGYIRS